jgi:hypothetical protein
MVGQDGARTTPASNRWWGLVFSGCSGGLVRAGVTCARSSGECVCTRSVGNTIADLTRFWIWVVFLVTALLLSLLAFTIGFEVGELLYPC